MSSMSTRTVEGTLAYCDYLRDKGYATAAQIDPWKTAIKKVFDTVEGEDYGSLDWSSIDMDEYLSRFQTLAGPQYKSESIVTYGRRMKNAFEAHQHYLTTGKVPSFRKGGSRNKAAESDGVAPPQNTPPTQAPSRLVSVPEVQNYEFNYPMSKGMAHISVPSSMSKRDIDRLITVLQTLEEQPQIPEHTGQVMAA
jgi:hypothetical protein